MIIPKQKKYDIKQPKNREKIDKKSKQFISNGKENKKKKK